MPKPPNESTLERRWIAYHYAHRRFLTDPMHRNEDFFDLPKLRAKIRLTIIEIDRAATVNRIHQIANETLARNIP